MSDALVLETMAQVAVILTFRTLDISERSGRLFFFAGIDKTRFQRRPSIGDRMVVEARVERIMKARGVGRFTTRATIDEQLVAQATMLAAVRAHSGDQNEPSIFSKL
jgi:3-hydroxymyristoyl/3-hydroxydecanoyl-(acyl carrier protein) dehydratase